MLRWQAEQQPDGVAILAPGRLPLSYRSLSLHIERTVKCLNGFGISRNDRVAIVLPNGPEMATAFLAVACGATSAPLNPNYRAKEFEFYLSDLNAKALIIQSDVESPAREVAQARGIPVLEISFEPDDEAGVFKLLGSEPEIDLVPDFSLPDDVALVLHTSGTTSKPKIVPLAQKNICTSAHNIKTTLELTAQDSCLNIMPLFHIHGLMAAVLSSLSTGASVVCTPGFQTDSFFEWLSSLKPTWYTAVPTMHQTILAKVQGDGDMVKNNSLKFMRSSSASLPPQVMKGLEEAFDAPMIESYGMTEASHQMTSNPLPPLHRNAGSVGIAAGPKVRIMDEAGKFLLVGETGEIVIQGENVTSGYENNSAANETAFTDGWFRTGDQGVMDSEGYLTITGRLKEIVNRGGEKIAPREVDEELLDHPDVAQAVAFAVPHPTLGEDLAAAVVLHANSIITEKELREFAFSRLADFKVPSQIVFVDEIPKGPTGKLQRIGLAEMLREKLEAVYTPAKYETEAALVGIWQKILNKERVGIQDNFFALGGDSLLAVSVLRETEEFIGKKLELPILFQAPTIEQISRLLQDITIDSESYLLPVRPTGSRKPFFLVPGHGGDIFTYAHLTRHLHPEQPVYVFRFREAARRDDAVANATIKEMATLYIKEMVAIQPEGPYNLGGFCFGAELAFEMAQQLHAEGIKTDLLAIIFQYLDGALRSPGWKERLSFHFERLTSGSFTDKVVYLKSFSTRFYEKISRRLVPSISRRFVRPTSLRPYMPRYYPDRITLFDPIQSSTAKNQDHTMGWKGLAAEIEAYGIPGDRHTIFREPNVQVLAEKLTECLENSSQ